MGFENYFSIIIVPKMCLCIISILIIYDLQFYYFLYLKSKDYIFFCFQQNLNFLFYDNFF